MVEGDDPDQVRGVAEGVDAGEVVVHPEVGPELEPALRNHPPVAERGVDAEPAVEPLALDVAGATDGVTSLLDADHLGGSEDATYLMRRVQQHGGKAAYVGVGTDHPGGHHTANFDVDEDTIGVGVAVLAGSIVEIAARRP